MCLKAYGDASGQIINLQKSSVIFGAKVPENSKAEIKRILGIEKEGGSGSYLGLPECFSGSKIKLLNFIKEKLQGRLQGWFAKTLSQGGKEILLKSVAMALPIYAMSCFKLPKDVCEKITSVMREFWWSSGNNKKKISWVAWKSLCKDKELGGLGFRDIEKFNQSLLAKQAWRIWSNPTSLLARILQQRYFARSSFLECSVGTRTSYAWRSILHGRELFSQGLLQKIGNGESTRVWIDTWIKTEVPRPPQYRQDAVVDLTLSVSDLINPIDGSWNIPRVREVIAEEDVDLVLNTGLDLSSQNGKVWGLSKSGFYNSKSGYKLAETLERLQAPPSPGLPPIERKLWKDLWKTHTSPKIRHFMWRVLSGALAVKERLRSRGILLDTTCPRCGLCEETISHVLFHCEAAKEALSLSQFPLPPGGFSRSSVWLNFYHLMFVSKKLPPENASRLSFPWILWNIWKARNSFCFEQVQYSVSSIFNKASEESAIWLSSQLLSSDSPSTSSSNTVVSLKWQKPPVGSVKCNVASSWTSSSQFFGAAWIARDSSGLPLFHSRRAFPLAPSAFEASLYSLGWAVSALLDLRVKRVILEISSPQTLDVLLNPQSYPNAALVISHILRSMHSFDQCQLLDVSLGVNSLAVEIATSVTKDRRFQSFVAKGGPLWLSSLLLSEARNDNLS